MILRRVGYYVVVLIVGVCVHQTVVARFLGVGMAAFLRRNSEAYVLMWLPAYWDMFAYRCDPDGRGAVASVGGAVQLSYQVVWVGAMVVTTFILQARAAAPMRDMLPQSIITLGEGFLGIAVVSVYLGWSRGIAHRRRRLVTGAAIVPGWQRAVYYGAVVLVAVLAQQSFVSDHISPDLAAWLQVNTEAYMAMLLIPAYFDLVAGRQRMWVWLACLAATPLVTQAWLHWGLAPRSVFAWLETTTEAFIAAFVISVYFWLIRGRWEPDGVSLAGEEVDRGR
ncbi:MAG: hypothetical protein WBV06_11595 [Acidimicrobiia bacterium]